MNRLNFDQEKQLIEYFRDNPSLWNTKDRDYNNRMLRTQKLETIAQFLHLTRKDVYEKYRNLRTTFFREHKRVIQSINCRSSASNDSSNVGNDQTQQSGPAYVSKWRHYQNMLFLTKVDKSLKSDSSSNGVHNDDSTSNELLASAHLSTVHNNGHDIKFLSDNHRSCSPKLSGANNDNNNNNNGQQQAQRPQPMDTTTPNNIDHASANGNTSNLVTNSLSTSAAAAVAAANIINHINNHNGEDLILVNASDAATLNGGTAILNGTVHGLLNTRIMTSSTNRSMPTMTPSSSGTIVPSSLERSNTNHTSTTANSVIYTNQMSNSANNGGNGIRVKSESGSDLQRHLSSPTLYPCSVLSTLPGALQFTNQPSISLNVAPNQANQLNSSAQVMALAAAVAAANPANQQNLLIPTVEHTNQPMDTSNGPFVLTGLHHNSIGTVTSNPIVPTSTIVGTIRTPPHHVKTGPTLVTNVVKSMANKVLEYDEMREVIKSVVQDAMVEYEDEEMAFCRSLASSLRSLDRSMKEIIKLELQQVIVRHTNPNYCGIGNGNIHQQAVVHNELIMKDIGKLPIDISPYKKQNFFY
ncbi:hypothetical protein BLOT_005209 [Blomia tropicalis]|nr:hypothetical protein BLOT_005209 [Blomia tropicalis]